jgi:hypothetical protein
LLTLTLVGPGVACAAGAEELCKLGSCELEQLFAQASPGPIPVGLARGRVLVLVDTRLPRCKVRLNNAVWKGKFFHDDGSFTNQWVGFQALDSNPCQVAPSWYDGKPCLAADYPPGTPVFGNSRDELRQIGPNLYLGLFWDRCPCPKLRGFFVLEVEGCCPAP